jgi:AcrR family transcriptional regulator
MPRVSNAAQSDQTQRALLAAARALFAERGYAATSLAAIAARAGVTRGALHYHFQNKAGLFYAVYTEMEGELMQGIVQSMAAAEGDEWQRILLAIDTFLDLSTTPAFQRVLYVDGPAVLNSAVPNPAGLSLIRQSLERLMTRGYIAAQPLESLARLWFGALVEGALYLVQAGDQPTAKADLTQSIARLFTGLRIPS